MKNKSRTDTEGAEKYDPLDQSQTGAEVEKLHGYFCLHFSRSQSVLMADKQNA